MNRKLKQALKFLLFLAVSVLLFGLVYRDQNWQELAIVLREEVDYTWLWISCVLGILSHVSRALRWQLLTSSMGYSMTFMNSFMGVMIGYFANLAIPRMGEFTRCGVVNRYEYVPFSKLLGTVVTERIIDMLILLFLLFVVIVTQFNQIGIFLANNREIEENATSFLHSWKVWALLTGAILLLIGLWKILIKTRFRDKVKKFKLGLTEGLLAVKDVKHKGLFIFYSLFIWLMYFLMMYVCFFCFDFTSQLSVSVGLTIFILGSFGMVAPVQGGIGAWHFMVIAGLMVYLPDVAGIENLSKVFALLTHSAMTLLYIVTGVLCLIFLPLYNDRLKCKSRIS